MWDSYRIVARFNRPPCLAPQDYMIAPRKHAARSRMMEIGMGVGEVRVFGRYQRWRPPQAELLL